MDIIPVGMKRPDGPDHGTKHRHGKEKLSHDHITSTFRLFAHFWYFEFVGYELCDRRKNPVDPRTFVRTRFCIRRDECSKPCG